MSDGKIVIQKHENIAIVRLSRPEKRNAIDMESVELLNAAARSFSRDESVAAIVLTGGPAAFSAGFDLKDPNFFGRELPLRHRRRSAHYAAETISLWQQLPQVTVAAMEGFAVGGGLAFALACDFRIAGTGCYFHVPEARMGSTFGLGSVPRLLSLISPSQVKRLILLNEKASARDAESWGLVDFLVDDGQAETKSLEIASHATEIPPIAREVSKRAINSCVTAMSNLTGYADIEQGIAAHAAGAD